ncbi:MAG: hypothetical protein HMLIMOIP_001988 [Candidatus Nitrosomirales archaeon]|jgi:hypothetical protein
MKRFDMNEHDLFSLIQACRSEANLDRQIQLLEQINHHLPELLRLKIPSLLTNDYVIRALDIIEDKTRYHEGDQFFLILDPGKNKPDIL